MDFSGTIISLHINYISDVCIKGNWSDISREVST